MSDYNFNPERKNKMPRMTEGEHRVGVDFNPSESGEVDQIKQQSAALIDRMNEIAGDRTHPGARCAALAMTAYEEAAMWAVKAVTKKPNTDD